MKKISTEEIFINLYNSLICRLCAEETLNGINLFQDNNQDICVLINRYLPIKISDDGQYPKLICPACHLQLESTQQFFDLVNKGQLKLKQLYKSCLQTKKSLTTGNSINNELQPDVTENIIIDEDPSHSPITSSTAVAITSDNDNNKKKYELSENELEQPADYNTLENKRSPLSKRKRGRPPKPPPEILAAKQVAAEAEYEAKQLEKLKEVIEFENEIICGLTKTGAERRKKRHIKIPLRFQEVVRGRELERVYVENGVIGKIQIKSSSSHIIDNNSSHIITDETQQIDGTNKIIGYLKDENGTNLGDLVNVVRKNNNNNQNKTEITSKKQRSITFICDICHRTFNHENRFVIHRKSHCNVIYECTSCLATFVKRIDLINHHIETQHTGQGIIESLEDECVDTGQSSVTEASSSPRTSTTINNELNLLSIFSEIVDNSDDVNEAAKVLYNLQNLQRPNHQPPEHGNEMIMVDSNNHIIEFECNDNKSMVDLSDNEKPPVVQTISGLPVTGLTVKKGNIKKKNRSKKVKKLVIAENIEKTGDDMDDIETTLLPKILHCKFCERTFTNVSSLIYHRDAEHSKLRRFVCVTCNKAFKHKQILQRHQLVHTNVRPFPCKQCKSSFKTVAHLKTHMTKHTGVKRFKCNKCDQMFTHKTSIKYHLQWHIGSKPFKCPDCGKSFTQNGNLREHMRVHTGERPYACDLCDKKFKTSSQHQIHKMRHFNLRPHVCEICSKTFLDGQTFKAHLRRHRNEKPFSCTQCTRQFSERWALNKHLRTHTGEKPYKCPFCDRRYADCSNLIRHKKIHDGEKKKDIDIEKNNELKVQYDTADNELKVQYDTAGNSTVPTLVTVTSSDIIDGISINDIIDTELTTNTNNYITKNETSTLLGFVNDHNPNINADINDKQTEQIIYFTYPKATDDKSAIENYEQFEPNKYIQISYDSSSTSTHLGAINNYTNNIEIITSSTTNAIKNELTTVYPTAFTYMGT